MINGILITGFGNVTKEGLTLKFNKKVSLGKGRIALEEWWVSWDKLGELMFKDEYHDISNLSVDEMRKLRGEHDKRED